MDKFFGKYTVTKKLGHGAMGVVYLGYDKYLERPVAIKTISSTMREEERKPRFIREAQSTAKLHHNNIVTIYDFGVEGEQLYIVMEYLEGHDLSELVSEKKAIDIKNRLEIVRQICLGLEYAHQHGVLHRDIKPGNIRVLEDGNVKIMDFGLATLNDTAPLPTITQSNAIMGTPHYIAPERIQGEKAEIRSDQFSVGVILYEMLTYHCPFTGDTISNIIFNILNTQPKRLDPEIIARFPEIDFIIKKSIAKNKEQRYRTMKEMASDISELQQKMMKQGFTMSEPIKIINQPMGTLDEINRETRITIDKYNEPTVELNPANTKTLASVMIMRPYLKTALLYGLPILGLLAVLYFFILAPKSPAPADVSVAFSSESIPASTEAQEGVLAFNAKPYASIDEVINIETEQHVSLAEGSRSTPVKLNLPSGKYRIVYSNPLWKEKKRIKIITVQPNESVYLEDRGEQDINSDAIKNFSIVRTKPALNIKDSLTTTIDKAGLSPAEELIDSGKQLLMEDKLNEAKDKFAAVLKLNSDHQAALYELNMLAIKYLNEGIEYYFNGDISKSEGLFREAVQIFSIGEVAEKYNKNLIIAYQFLAVDLIEKHYLENKEGGQALEEAKSYIVRIFAINSSFELEEKYFSPKVVEIFSK